MDEDWRERLRAAVEASEKSMRDLSLKAKLSPGYLHSILQDGKEPTVANLLKIAKVLDRPVVTLFEEEGRAEAYLRLRHTLGKLSPEQLRILETMAWALMQAPETPESAASTDRPPSGQRKP